MSLMREQLDRKIETMFVHFVHSAQGQLHLECSLHMKDAFIGQGLSVADEASIR